MAMSRIKPQTIIIHSSLVLSLVSQIEWKSYINVSSTNYSTQYQRLRRTDVKYLVIRVLLNP